MSTKRLTIYAAVVFILLSVIALAPFLFFDRMFSNTDAVTYYYPAFHFYGEALSQGQSFLWNPYVFSGFPMYLSQSAGFLDPLNIVLFKIFNAFDAYHLRLLLGYVLAMFFSFLAARSFGLSNLAALLVGPAYLGAFHWWYVSNPVIVNSLFLLPFLMWVSSHLRGPRAFWWTLVAGAGIGWSLLSGYAQLTVYVVSAWGVYTLAGSFWVMRESWREMARKTLLLGGAVLVGGIIALPQILSALEFVPLTVRAGGLAYDLATFKVINPGDLVLFLFPDYLYFPYLSGGRRPLFVGALLFLLSVAAVFYLIARLYRHKHYELTEIERRMLIISGIGIFCFITAFVHSPIYYLLQHVPVFSYFRFPYRFMYAGIWFVAVLGAYGLDLVRHQTFMPILKRFSSVYAAFVGILTVGVVALYVMGDVWRERIADWLHTLLSMVAYGRFGFTKDASHYREALERGIAAWQEALSLSDPAFALPLLLLLATCALLYCFSRGYVSILQFRIAGAALSLGTFLVIFVVQWPTTLPQATTQAHASVLEFMPAQEKVLYRTYPLMLGESLNAYIPPQYTLNNEELKATTLTQFWSGWPNTNIYAGVASADGYDPFVPEKLLRTLQDAGSTHSGEEVTRQLSTFEKQQRLYTHLNVLGAMSVKYIIAGLPLTHRDLQLVHTVSVPPFGATLYIYKNAQALPRVRWGSSGFAADTLSLEKAENGYLMLRTQTRALRTIVIAESLLPGWRATVDGTSVPIRVVDEFYMAIDVEAGAHEITLVYEGMLGELRVFELLGLVKKR